MKNKKQFKFRVWDYTGITWATVFSINLLEDCCLNNSEHEVSQFIGIQDKNSKEIYEGDIVTANLTYSHEAKFTGVVEYSVETLNYVLRFNPNNLPYESLFEDLNMLTNFEVIGNIYENENIAEEYGLSDKNIKL